MQTMTSKFEHLLPPSYKNNVLLWLQEDCPSFDIGGFVVGDKMNTAELLCKQNCILAGVPFINAVFQYFNLQVHWLYEEGSVITISSNMPVVIATIIGPCKDILIAERTALNILSRASGVATLARRYNLIKERVGWQGHISGTRKTTPGFRLVEKYALMVGGAETHRMDLSQMVMLKDNHIWSTGSISNALLMARKVSGVCTKIEVECQSRAEALEAAANGADIIMLDNFRAESVRDVAKEVKGLYPNVIIEASGGIDDANMQFFMTEDVDIISRGSLTQGYPCIDFSMKIVP